MKFNPDKCEHISVTNKKKPLKTSYSLHGQTLKQVKNTKYLGVTIDNSLSWNDHINNVTRGFPRRAPGAMGALKLKMAP